MNVKTPTAVQRWISSDGREHQTEQDARCQEVFLAVLPILKDELGPTVAAHAGHAIVTKLAKHFDLIPRGKAE